MRRLMSAVLAVAIGVLGTARAARAGEEDDLQRQIETQRAGMSDLERLDDLRATTDEITLLKSWLDEAWSLRSKHEYDLVREVLDRCLAQAELIRQKIAAAKLRAQVQRREAALKEVRTKIASARKALQETTIKKRALEGSTQ
jgi:predicted  nucleic acid-binding Zn-ribbon protein